MLDKVVCVIGVGYVGEHLVDTFKNSYRIIGVDLNENRIKYLKNVFFQMVQIQEMICFLCLLPNTILLPTVLLVGGVLG